MASLDRSNWVSLQPVIDVMKMTPSRFAPRRELGRTGFVATRLGIGDLADRNLPLETCVLTLRRALDTGLNLVDTAPDYEDGTQQSER